MDKHDTTRYDHRQRPRVTNSESKKVTFTGEVNSENAPDVVRAKKFVLLDEAGETRANWSTEPGGAGKLVFLQGGVPRLGLFVLPSGDAILDVRDKHSIGRLRLGVVEEGRPTLSLMDEDGKTNRIGLAVQADGVASLGFGRAGATPPGRSPLSLLVGKDGATSINLVGPENKTRLALFLNPDGATGLGILSEEGRQLLGSTILANGMPINFLANPDGQGRIDMSGQPGAWPAIQIRNDEGKVNWQQR
jgi:hypothetical protein